MDSGPAFRASISYDYNDVQLPQGDFVVRLARVGLDYIMSAKLSWVNLIQYDNATETTGINSRLHWIPEAGRELFVVLNHNLEDFDRDESLPLRYRGSHDQVPSHVSVLANRCASHRNGASWSWSGVWRRHCRTAATVRSTAGSPSCRV